MREPQRSARASLDACSGRPKQAESLWKIGRTADLPAVADAGETYVPPAEARAKDDSRAIFMDRGRNRVRHRVEEVWIRTATDAAKDEPERGYARLSAFTRRADNRMRERR
jgi:hypothetical protein